MPGIAGEIERKFSQVITEKLVICEKFKSNVRETWRVILVSVS